MVTGNERGALPVLTDNSPDICAYLITNDRHGARIYVCQASPLKTASRDCRKSPNVWCKLYCPRGWCH